ncbi:hypothetical protein NYE69_17910 [Paenibacillus sp. FSL R5-0527]|uniref:hypothetical protein n=1 Tax=Paenibacillus TaxID=44249 RepID=UPI00097AE608|nr:hypothetical protein [Paenibacillus macerans]MEC0329160.1 hypothetical protein [Paenibacillus macerans]OMG47227.1 hypothetical protein BK140_23045 [Paenibacillus macerans]
MEVTQFKEILSFLFVNSEFIEENGSCIFRHRHIELQFNEEHIKMLLNELEQHKQKENTLLFSNTYFETLVSIENQRFSPRMMDKYLSIEDKQNKIVYEISKASDKYILFLLNVLFEHGLIKEFKRRSMMFNPVLQERASGCEDLFDYLRMVFRMIYTLKISTEDNRNLLEFEQLSNSYLFHMAYNFDISIIETKLLEEFVSTERLERVRRNNDVIDPPRRKYMSDLVHHYQMAVSTESPYLKFISYYHIMEHFFEKIYNEELVRLVQNEVSNPSFSIKRENDIKKVIKLITKKIQSRKEEFSINEKEALELTLSKFIDIDALKSKLHEYDNTLLDFYKNNEVVFSGGMKVDFEDSQEKEVVKKIASRIYATRNSIVHSKDNEKLKYTPFKHDKFLIKEIPLLRFIAEEIILSNSQLL